MENSRITEKLIGFALCARYQDLPQRVIKVQKQSLLDSLGVMGAAASLEPACRPFIEYALENSPEPSCTIIGTGKKASPVMAAMANGALIHALDYEDGHDLSKAHPNTASVPVLLALAESGRRGPVSGKDFLLAMAVGSELVCRLKLALLADDLQNGWYSPSMFSAYGAVFSGAGVMKLPPSRTLDALSLCMTQIMLPGQAARSRESSLRAVRDAFSARAAAMSLILAEKGVEARMDEPFEGPLGLYHMMVKGKYDPAVILQDLGETWISSALRYKYWPCCGTTHGGIHALLSLLKENNLLPFYPGWHTAAGKTGSAGRTESGKILKPEEILEIHLTIDPIHLRVLEPYETKYRPGTLAAAKFSMPFCLSLALAFGDIRLDMFTEEQLLSEMLLQTARKVTWEIRPGGSDGLGDDHIKVTLRTTHGSYEKEVSESPGSPGLPLTREQLWQKYLDCTRFFPHAADMEKVLSVRENIDHFEDIQDVGSFIKDHFT